MPYTAPGVSVCIGGSWLTHTPFLFHICGGHIWLPSALIYRFIVMKCGHLPRFRLKYGPTAGLPVLHKIENPFYPYSFPYIGAVVRQSAISALTYPLDQGRV